MYICKADPVHPMLLLFSLQNAQRGAVNTSRGGSATLCSRNNQQTINMLTTRHAMTPPVPYEPRSAVQWSLACTAQPGNDFKTKQPQNHSVAYTHTAALEMIPEQPRSFTVPGTPGRTALRASVLGLSDLVQGTCSGPVSLKDRLPLTDHFKRGIDNHN